MVVSPFSRSLVKRGLSIVMQSMIWMSRSKAAESSSMVLCPFSQGGAVALHTALRYQQPLAGVMVLSSYLPIAEFVAEEKSEANAKLPIFIAHGDEDHILPLVAAELTQEYLANYDYQIETHIYSMAHQVCYKEIQDISAWLQRVLT